MHPSRQSRQTTRSYRTVLPLLLALVLALGAAVALLSGAPALAQDPPGEPRADSSGALIDTEAAAADPTADPQARSQSGVSVVCFSTDTDGGPCSRVAGIFSDTTHISSVSALSETDLSPYDAFYLGNFEQNALDNRAAQLQAYVNGGGGLVVTQPNIEGWIAVFPPGFEMYVSDRFWPEYPDEPGPVEFTPAGQEHPILSGLTPDALSGNFDATPIDRVGPGWTVLAKAVNDPNLALAAGQYGSGRMAYHTGNIESGSIDPGSDAYVRQLIEWAAAASAPDGPDMAIDAIEVTQAVQDLNNSVDLVAGKTTFVRVHVSSPATAYDVFANLSAERDGMRLFPTLHPGNPGADIAVRPFPDRGAINDSYWFELPAGWTTPGTVTLTATLDPAAAQGDPDRSNNAMSAVVDFLSTPPLALQLFDVRYTEDGTTYTAGNKHLDALEEWLEAAYPIPNLDQQRQTFDYPKDGLPDVDELHGYLAIAKLLNIFINDEDGDVVYYGIVDDEGGFMRGKALDIPSDIAAGPTGDTDTHAAGDQVEDWTWGWDYDGSYGDWYGGHELGHTQGRWHAEFCGAADGKSYPYTGGRISPALSGDNALYGFDIRDRTIYGPSWKDVMSYCDNEWVSDFTYEGIRDHMVANQQAAQTEAPDALESPAVTADRFALVVASVDLATNTGAIDNVYILDQTKEMPLPEPGDWTLVLLDGADNVLATHSVEAHQLTASEQVEGIPAIIRAAVPAPEALHRLELRHDGNTVDAREVSANAPTVNITAPEPNQELPAGDITFSWEGSDPDGDSLTYSLFYSHDDGMSWTPLTSATSATELTLPSDRLPGGTSHLRVVASDGMLTGSDVVGPFYAPAHAPQVEITNPADGATFWAAQLVSFRVDAYDLEDGPLSGNSILWTSSIDGELGTGRALSTVNLSTGLHTITAEATDSTGRSAQAQITVEVLTGDAPEPSRLEATPDAIDPVVPLSAPPVTESLLIRNSAGFTLSWTLEETRDWLTLSATSGETPAEVTLTFDPTGLAPGTYRGTLTLSAGEAANSPLEIPVALTVEEEQVQEERFQMYLPVIVRPPAE